MKTEVAAMENLASSVTDPVPTEPASATELQVQPPASSIPKPEPLFDLTDLSDTTESEAEKHGCK